MAPAIPIITINATDSIGVPLTLTCLSVGGYPQQTVDWYRETISDNNRLDGNVTAVQDGLFNVTNRLTFTPNISDNGVKFVCQSTYTGAPQLIGQTEVVIISMTKRLPMKLLFR